MMVEMLQLGQRFLSCNICSEMVEIQIHWQILPVISSQRNPVQRFHSVGNRMLSRSLYVTFPANIQLNVLC